MADSVATSDVVAAGPTLAVLKSMKMHYQIFANATDEVTEVLAADGKPVAANDLLIEISVAE